MDPDSDIEYIPNTEDVTVYYYGMLSKSSYGYISYESLTLQEFYNKYTITDGPKYSSTSPVARTSTFGGGGSYAIGGGIGGNYSLNPKPFIGG